MYVWVFVGSVWESLATVPFLVFKTDTRIVHIYIYMHTYSKGPVAHVTNADEARSANEIHTYLRRVEQQPVRAADVAHGAFVQER